MLKILYNFKNYTYILSMWLVLFSLTPCTIKEVFFHAVDLDYAKPLNKSKTSTNSCSYSKIENRQTSGTKKSKILSRITPFSFSTNLNFALCSSKTFKDYSRISLGNSPPKYILYKRLKIDIA
ncbi:hypothetical protein [Chryseobacterium sp.]|uniref:hypothetical protein n=1 Tax=Chryseobacterium sp. TaxID=1871047 RepID=UPI00388D6F0A